jgi:hypothetical protein
MKFSKFNQPKRAKLKRTPTQNELDRHQDKVNAAINHMEKMNEHEEKEKK